MIISAKSIYNLELLSPHNSRKMSSCLIFAQLLRSSNCGDRVLAALILFLNWALTFLSCDVLPKSLWKKYCNNLLHYRTRLIFWQFEQISLTSNVLQNMQNFFYIFISGRKSVTIMNFIQRLAFKSHIIFILALNFLSRFRH